MHGQKKKIVIVLERTIDRPSLYNVSRLHSTGILLVNLGAHYQWYKRKIKTIFYRIIKLFRDYIQHVELTNKIDNHQK